MTLAAAIVCLGLFGCGEPAPTTDGTIATTLPANPTTTQPQKTEPPTSKPEDAADLLVGSWHRDAYWGDCMDLKTYTFAGDGTFTGQDQLLTPTAKESGLYTYGTYWEGSIRSAQKGTYTAEGRRLTLSYTIVDPKTFKEYTVVNSYFIQVLDDVLHLTDTKTGETEQLYSGTFPSEDAAAPEAELSPLSGTWTSICDGGDEAEYRGNRLAMRTMRFYSNGTVIIDSCLYIYAPHWQTGEWNWERYFDTEQATFTFDGTTLVITFPYIAGVIRDEYVETYTVSALDGTHLVIDDRWGTYIDPQAVPYDGLEGLCNAIGVEYAPVKYDDGDETP